MANTVPEFIDDRGGPTKVAAAIGYKPGAIHLWRHRKKVPRTAWPDLLDAFPDLTIDDLKALEAA